MTVKFITARVRSYARDVCRREGTTIHLPADGSLPAGDDPAWGPWREARMPVVVMGGPDRHDTPRRPDLRKVLRRR